MREGIMFGLRTLGKYIVLFLLSLMFLGMIPPTQLWLQALLNAVFLAGFALLAWNEAGAVGERAETLRVTLESRRAEGLKVDSLAEAKTYRPATAVVGFFAAALPLVVIALLNLASLPSHPESLDPANFTIPIEEQQAADTAALPEATPADATVMPEATPAADATVMLEATPAADAVVSTDATPAPDAVSEQAAAIPVNPFNTVARLAFSPFIALYGLLANNLTALYLLMIPLSFFLPAFALAGYLRGPKLREKKLEAIKKGIRAKKRKERRERKNMGPKPEV
jgi:hypothetical protein